MGQFSLEKLFGMTIRESATDGSDFTNPDADYRRLFLGEDGLLHVKDSAGTVTDPYTSSSGAPSTAQYIVGAADGGLSAEKVRADLYKNYNPDAYPATFNAVSNEFDGGAGGSYAWTSAPSVSDENTTFPGHLYVEFNTNDGTTYRYYRTAYAPGATNFTVAAKVEIAMSYNANQAWQFGIALLDSSDAVIWRNLVLNENAATDVLAIRYNDTNVGSVAIQTGMTIPIYLMIQRTSANVYTGLWSFNGKLWVIGGSSTVATTVAKVAIAGISGNTSVKYGTIDFIRVFDSLTRKIGS